MELNDLFFVSCCVSLKDEKLELALQGNTLYQKFGERISDSHMPVILTFLSKHSSVISLNLSYNRLTDSAVWSIFQFLKKHKSLLHLNLMCNDIKSRGIQWFCDLRGQSELKSLRVNGNKFGPKGCRSLALFLEQNKHLKHLDIAETDQDVASLVYFITVLREDQNPNQTLKVLDLSRPLGQMMHTFDSAHFAHTIGQMLRFNSCLAELHLQKYGFSDHDVELLFHGLSCNQSLLLLDLSCNNIGDFGVEYLGKYLKECPPLRGLLLNHNMITDTGARTLSFTMPYSKLWLLDVAHNKITDAGILDILNTLSKASPIQALYIWGNTVTHSSCIVIKRMIHSQVLSQDKLDVKLYNVDDKYYVAFNNADRYKHIYYCVCGDSRDTAESLEYIIPTQIIDMNSRKVITRIK